MDRHVKKLSKFLKAYEPDLVQLHGVFAVNPHKEEHSCTLNLSLPTGSLHATGVEKTARGACTKAFKELDAQVKKHQALLRKGRISGNASARAKRPQPWLPESPDGNSIVRTFICCNSIRAGARLRVVVSFR